MIDIIFQFLMMFFILFFFKNLLIEILIRTLISIFVLSYMGTIMNINYLPIWYFYFITSLFCVWCILPMRDLFIEIKKNEVRK